MGYRTLSWTLVLRALFLNRSAYDAIRDDDNPFIEGAVLVVLLGAVTALLAAIGELVKWAGSPSMDAVQNAVLQGLQQQAWWPSLAANPQALAEFNRYWDLGWRVFPALFGASSPVGAAFNVLAWPVLGVLGWLIFGTLAFLFARLLGGRGTLNQTLGTTALAVSPLLLRGLGFIPFLVIGGVLNTWQLICRYQALRSAHQFSWQRALWATVLPFLVYALFWLAVIFAGSSILAGLAGR